MRTYILCLLIWATAASVQAQNAMNAADAKNLVVKTTTAFVHFKAQLQSAPAPLNLYAAALDHQRYAVQQYRMGNYMAAANHSIHARAILFRVYAVTGIAQPADFAFSPSEQTVLDNKPSEATLYQELETQFTAVMYRTDDRAIHDDLTDLRLPE